MLQSSNSCTSKKFCLFHICLAFHKLLIYPHAVKNEAQIFFKRV